MSNFNDVSNKDVQAFNRMKFASNLRTDFGEARAAKYLSQFSDVEVLGVVRMIGRVSKEGLPNMTAYISGLAQEELV